MEFWTKLIKTSMPYTKQSLHSLNVNCTHVKGNYYIFEGEVFALEEDGVNFEIIGEGGVPCLGDLSEQELIQICDECYGVEKEIFNETK